MAYSNELVTDTTNIKYATFKNLFDNHKYSFLMAEDNPDDILITKRAWKKASIKNKLYIVNDGEEALNFLYKRDLWFFFFNVY